MRELTYEDIRVGKLYYISNNFNHAVLDLNPNDCMSSPVYIIKPYDIFMILDMDIWLTGEGSKFYKNYICVKILFEDIIGWIMVEPKDLQVLGDI